MCTFPPVHVFLHILCEPHLTCFLGLQQIILQNRSSDKWLVILNGCGKHLLIKIIFKATNVLQGHQIWWTLTWFWWFVNSEYEHILRILVFSCTLITKLWYTILLYLTILNASGLLTAHPTICVIYAQIVSDQYICGTWQDGFFIAYFDNNHCPSTCNIFTLDKDI